MAMQASIDTHTRAQCSHASVGLAQAHPNQQLESQLASYLLYL